MNETFTVRASDSAGNETVATKTFQVGGGETVIPINVPTNGTDATAAFNTAVAALPNGTPGNLTVGLLPPGTITFTGAFTPTVGIQMVSKQWVELRGQPTTVLYWPDYGPWSPGGRQERRHFVLGGCRNVTVRGIHIKGPHTVRSPESNNWSLYMPSKAFQHGFTLSSCFNMNFFDCSVYEIAGDGMYLNTVDDLLVDGFRVQYNGRQGIAGIDGQRWVFDHVNIVLSPRGSIDWEPIGFVGTRLRWITDVEIRNSTLMGIMGVILHRCEGQWLHHNRSSDIRLDDTTPEVLARRTVRITDNDFGIWSVTTSNWPVVSAMAFKELIVTGNRVARKVTNPASRDSPLVRLFDPLVSGATITVKDNIATDFVTALATSVNWTSATIDTVVAANTWDVGNNDLGHGVIQGEPPWLASRLGG